MDNDRVPLYAISSLIAIFSLEAAFFIDAIRDLYEVCLVQMRDRSDRTVSLIIQAFVIYTFLQLLITYLGGERSLLIILHGRPPIPHPFPVNIFLRPMDVSDPWTLLNLKRGVLRESSPPRLGARREKAQVDMRNHRICSDQATPRHRYRHSQSHRYLSRRSLRRRFRLHLRLGRLQHLHLSLALVRIAWP